jgi:predicted nucleic acid-binding protein
MKVTDALARVRRVFLDTAPIIYFIEANPRYIDVVSPVFARIDDGSLTGVTSPITLAETLVVPYRLGSGTLAQRYLDRIVYGHNTEFVPLDEQVACQAAELRARYNLRLPDAFQVAAARHAQCDALLTNDPMLRRAADLSILLIGEP